MKGRITDAEIKVVLERHGKWQRDDVGSRTNLSGADLSGIELPYAIRMIGPIGSERGTLVVHFKQGYQHDSSL